jgi:hypothetical protein
MKSRYLVVYDYGMGGVWGYVLATSAEEIEARFSELQVIPEVPSWMSEDDRASLERTAQDIDEPGEGPLTSILGRRTS